MKLQLELCGLGSVFIFNNHRKRAEQALCDVAAAVHGVDGSPPGMGERLELG